MIEQNTYSPLTEKEKSQYRQLIGQLNWITNMTKPEFSFEVCYASTIVNSATISDITMLNKVLKDIKSEKSYIKFPSLNIDSLSIRIYTNTSFNNLPKEKSRWTNNVYHRQRKPELSISIELIKNRMCSLINLSS